ncbi:MAG: hypothetical protein RL038_84 [Actinomycetota bacterium]|jgi:drug/metabolite transporter (DMT)-like permease
MTKPYVYLILAMLAWGFSNPFSDLALEHLPIGWMFLVELGTGFIVLSFFFRRTWLQLPWKAVAALGLLQPGLTYFFGNLGYASGTVATGLIIMSSEVLLLAIFGWWFLRESLRPKELFALLVGFGGAVIAGYSAQANSIGSLWSNLFFAFAAIAAAGYSVLIRKLALEDQNLDAVGLAWGQAFVAFLFAALTFPVTTTLTSGEFDFALVGYLAAAGSGVFGVALPFVWYAKAAVSVSTGHAAIGLNLIAVFGILIGALIGRGLPTPLQVVGGALVLLSVFATEQRQQQAD